MGGLDGEQKQLIKKLVHFRMKKGKRTRVRAIVYQTFHCPAQTERDVIKLLLDAVENIKPICEVEKVGVAGTIYDVPGIVARDRQQTLAIRWILEAAFKRRISYRISLEKCSFAEILDAYRKRGIARKKRENLHGLASTNRSFAHFRWCSFEEAGRGCPREGAEFGYLCSRQIGNPLWCDSPTVQRDRLAYARVCVEVMPNSELPKEVLLMNNEGIQTRIPVEYEWVLVPALCGDCGVIGHKPEHCSTLLGGRESHKKGYRFDVLGLVEDEEYVAEVAGQKDIDSSGNDVSANSQSAEVQDLTGGIATLGRHSPISPRSSLLLEGATKQSTI
ncbi:Ribosomal protein S7, partial [Quillaja saponaria]